MSEPELGAVAELWKRTGREVTARFTGRSMEPAIPSGSEVRLLCGAAAGVGDVVAFLRDGHVVVHRLVGESRKHGWLLTQGDAFILPDPPILDTGVVLGRIFGVRTEDGFASPPPPAQGTARRLTLRACLGLLAWSPPLGAAILRWARWLRPATRRHRGRLSDSLLGM